MHPQDQFIDNSREEGTEENFSKDFGVFVIKARASVPDSLDKPGIASHFSPRGNPTCRRCTRHFPNLAARSGNRSADLSLLVTRSAP